MNYTIGEVANAIGIAISTLRYYDHEGMSIKSIKEFLIWCQEGDASLEKRREMFYARLEEVEMQIERLQTIRNQ